MSRNYWRSIEEALSIYYRRHQAMKLKRPAARGFRLATRGEWRGAGAAWRRSRARRVRVGCARRQ